jgi:hypothetical protein
MIWSLIFGFLKSVIGPVFDFLNKRVDAEEQMHIVDTTTIGTIAAGGEDAAKVADQLNAQIRMKEGPWGPMVWMMILILLPLLWHEWQVVLDSSRWVIVWEGWYPWIAEHAVGTWKVAALPGSWDNTELAILQSFFIGATASATAVAAIRAIKK